MNEWVKNLRDWCVDQKESLNRGISLMENGTFRTHEQRGGGAMTDTTEATLADYRRKISELDDLLAQIDNDHPGM